MGGVMGLNQPTYVPHVVSLSKVMEYMLHSLFCDAHLENKLEMAGNATPSPAPIMLLDMQRGINMKPRSAAVGVNIVNKDHRTTPAPRTIFEEYFVAT